MTVSPPSSRQGLPRQWSDDGHGGVIATVDVNTSEPLQVLGLAGQAIIMEVFDNNGFGLAVDGAGAVACSLDPVVTATPVLDARLDSTQIGLRVRDVTNGVDTLRSTAAIPLRILRTGGAAIRYGAAYAANPADPPSGEADMFVIDLGATQFLRVRYNDGGVMKEGSVGLV